MGQKINPVGFRTGSFLPWKSRWFASNSQFKDYLVEDVKIRRGLMGKLTAAGITSIEIERLTKSMSIILNVSRPGVVIGRGGSGIDDVKKYVMEILKETRGSMPKNQKIDFQVKEIKNPDLSAQLTLMRIIQDLERRLPHRRVVTKAMERATNAGALGIKVVLSGRIGGSDIARVEKFHQGSVPTQTLRKDIDYAQTPALLKKGYVGVKVWIYKKDE
jgi:small subunit ribosomal protein S3